MRRVYASGTAAVEGPGARRPAARPGLLPAGGRGYLRFAVPKGTSMNPDNASADEEQEDIDAKGHLIMVQPALLKQVVQHNRPHQERDPFGSMSDGPHPPDSKQVAKSLVTLSQFQEFTGHVGGLSR